MDLKLGDYLTIPQVAKLLGISRIAVYRQVKSGKIKATRFGRNYAISKKYIMEIAGKPFSDKDREQVDIAIKRALEQYGKAIKRLGEE